MKKISAIGSKAGFVLAIAGAAVVGGATTALVSAAIPSTADNQIHGCYRNNASLTDAKGALRVIDSQAGQTCTGQETALNWNPGGSSQGGFVSDLKNSDFTEASLQYRDFRGFNFSGSRFDGARLSGADFRGANLSGTMFIPGTSHDIKIDATTNLSGAFLDLSAVNLYNGEDRGYPVNFFKTINLTDVTLGGRMTGDDLSGLDLRQLDQLSDSNLYLLDVNLSNVNFSNSQIQYLYVGGMTDLRNSNFSGTRFKSSFFVSSQIIDPRTGHDATGNVKADNANFSGASFTDSSFATMDMTGANFANTTWTNTICSDGTNSDNNGNTCIGHLVP